jgi:hypothetical protein
LIDPFVISGGGEEQHLLFDIRKEPDLVFFANQRLIYLDTVDGIRTSTEVKMMHPGPKIGCIGRLQDGQ